MARGSLEALLLILYLCFTLCGTRKILGLATWVKDGAVPKPEFFAHQLPFNVPLIARKMVHMT